jgi:hypothetical protein
MASAMTTRTSARAPVAIFAMITVVGVHSTSTRTRVDASKAGTIPASKAPRTASPAITRSVGRPAGFAIVHFSPANHIAGRQ